MAGRGVVYLFVLGVIAVVSIGLVVGTRRADRRSEVSRWARATQYLNAICPPADNTATLWCRVVVADAAADAAHAADAAEEDPAGRVADIVTATSREIPAQSTATTRQSGADAA